MIDRVAESVGRPLVEVPVGFKWFVPGLIDGSIGFGGEESAGASFLRRDGSAWTTDKDGIILALLASEILAATGEVPEPALRRPDRAARRPGVRPDRRARRPRAEGQARRALPGRRRPPRALAGEPITAKLTEAPGNGAKIGGLKVTTESRLVRRPPVRHRGRLQDLRRVLPGPRAPRPGAGRGPRWSSAALTG